MAVIEMIHEAVVDTREEEYSVLDVDGNRVKKTKTSFWASESEVMAFDIYHRWMETIATHPMSEEKQVMLKMRKLTEEAIVSFLRRSGQLIEKFTNTERMFFEWGPHKVPVSGYPDLGLELDGHPVIVEVKTYYGNRQHSDIRNGKVKTSYLKQLAMYLWHFKCDHGVLLMVNQGTGEMFEFELYRVDGKEYHFLCPDNTIEINLEEVFKRFETIWVENIQKKVEPAPEFIYKYDIEKIKWDEVSADAIRKARNGHAVIGDWQCKFSDFKGLIAERQGTCLGYNETELARIKELTAGYSAKRQKNTVRFDPTQIENL